MLSDNIRQFLQDLDAKIPNEFSSEIDETHGILAGDITSELVDSGILADEPPTMADNIEYSKVDPCQKVSASDPVDRTDYLSEFPIHGSAAGGAF